MDKTYTREEYVYLAKLYERAERYEDMVVWITKFIQLEPKLSLDERNILSAGFKNIIGGKRSSWRLLQNLERKEEKKGNNGNLNGVRDVKKKVENEMRKICDDIQGILDKFLVPNAKDSENKVFYLKLKGDYYRYRAEFTDGKENEENTNKADKVYKEAYDIAEKDIPIANSTRLGLALNFSVFYYEIRNFKEEACQIAKNAFEEAIKILDDLERSKAKDTILIIQLLKENLILWNNEMNEEEGEN
jgi:14-3-3 protein epsilon